MLNGLHEVDGTQANPRVVIRGVGGDQRCEVGFPFGQRTGVQVRDGRLLAASSA